MEWAVIQEFDFFIFNPPHLLFITPSVVSFVYFQDVAYV